MSDEKLPYRKVGNLYVFTFEEAGKTFIVRCNIGPGTYSINGDSLALFPDRSSGHKRIMAYLDSRK